MKYHAFLMPVHKQPHLLARIINILQAKNHFFFIHIDGHATNYQQFVEACKGMQNVTFVKRIIVTHGSIKQVDATLIMLDAVIKHPIHFDYIHQTSGSDYPLRSNEQFDDFFENTQDSFMCFNYENQMDYWMPIYLSHTNGYHFNGTNEFFDKFLRKFGKTKWFNTLFPRNPIEDLAGAWDWFSWSDKVYLFVLDNLKFKNGKCHAPIYKRFNHTYAPGEHLWPTILYQHVKELNIRKHYPLHYVSWNPKRPVSTLYRPYNLNELDYKYVIESPTFFCRKVDEIESAKLLDMIDEQRGTYFDITKYKDFF